MAIFTSAPATGEMRNDVGASHLEPGWKCAESYGGFGENASHRSAEIRRSPAAARMPSVQTAITRIPASNPFKGPGQVPEIYAYGFRNPYIASHSTKANGQLIVGDVGQKQR